MPFVLSANKPEAVAKFLKQQKRAIKTFTEARKQQHLKEPQQQQQQEQQHPQQQQREKCAGQLLHKQQLIMQQMSRKQLKRKGLGKRNKHKLKQQQQQQQQLQGQQQNEQLQREEEQQQHQQQQQRIKQHAPNGNLKCGETNERKSSNGGKDEKLWQCMAGWPLKCSSKKWQLAFSLLLFTVLLAILIGILQRLPLQVSAGTGFGGNNSRKMTFASIAQAQGSTTAKTPNNGNAALKHRVAGDSSAGSLQSMKTAKPVSVTSRPKRNVKAIRSNGREIRRTALVPRKRSKRASASDGQFETSAERHARAAQQKPSKHISTFMSMRDFNWTLFGLRKYQNFSLAQLLSQPYNISITTFLHNLNNLSFFLNANNYTNLSSIFSTFPGDGDGDFDGDADRDDQIESQGNFRENCLENRNSFATLGTVILYTIVCAVGLFGNSLVIYVVLRFSKMQTVTNIYILNLAIADEFFLVGLPFLIYTMRICSWKFGEYMCKAYMVSTSITQFTSSIFLLIMSADRFIAVCHPIESPRYRTLNIAKLVSAIAWLTSAVLMLPVILFTNTVLQDDGINYSCNIDWPEKYKRHTGATFILYSFFLGFATPLFFILWFYYLVIRKLHAVGKKHKSKEKKRSHRKVTRLVLTVITVYILCWLPHWVSQVALINTGPDQSDLSRLEVLLILLFGCLAYSNSAMNPILYAFLSDNFRKSFFKAFTCMSNLEINAQLQPEPSVFTKHGGSRRRVGSRRRAGSIAATTPKSKALTAACRGGSGGSGGGGDGDGGGGAGSGSGSGGCISGGGSGNSNDIGDGNAADHVGGGNASGRTCSAHDNAHKKQRMPMLGNNTSSTTTSSTTTTAEKSIAIVVGNNTNSLVTQAAQPGSQATTTNGRLNRKNDAVAYVSDNEQNICATILNDYEPLTELQTDV